MRNAVKRLEVQRDTFDAKYETRRYEQMIAFEFSDQQTCEEENQIELARLDKILKEQQFVQVNSLRKVQ